MTTKRYDPILAIQVRQLRAYLSKSGEQKWATPEELAMLCRGRAPSALRKLTKGCRSACHCCGNMARCVYDDHGMTYCIGCVETAIADWNNRG